MKCFQRLVGAKSCPKSVRIWCASTLGSQEVIQRSFKLKYACASVDMYIYDIKTSSVLQSCEEEEGTIINKSFVKVSDSCSM